MFKKNIISGIFIPILFPLVVFAYANPGAPKGFINDFTGTFNDAQRQQLEDKISAFEKNTGNEIAIAIIPNLGGDTIENFSVKLFEEWKIGKKGKDNGVLVLVAKDDRQMRIEIGYGLEGALTDAQSSWIINNVMAPAFRDGDFYKGLDAAIDKIIAAIGGEVIPDYVPEKSTGGQGNYFYIASLIIFAFMWLASILGRSKSWWVGGVLGGVAGIIIGFLKGFLYLGLISLGVLIPLGLLFDFLVSRSFEKSKVQGRRPPWWIGGGGFGGRGGGGFGGFGGGGSGGGGASGRW